MSNASSPAKYENVSTDHTTPSKNDWDEGNFFNKWTFQVSNRMINEGNKEPLQYNQLSDICDRDTSYFLMKRLESVYQSSKSFWFIPRLMVALIRCNIRDVVIMLFYTITEGASRIVSPIILIFLLRALQDDSKGADEAYMWAGLLSAVAFAQVVIHHVLFFFSMRLGWNWKNACTALVHHHLLTLDGATLNASGSGTGMLVNLISNDVSRFEEFTVVCFH